jgi:4-diphosphocytidyl-2-C-methyl-D-erythritol kinase
MSTSPAHGGASEALSVLCPAKVNLALSVGPRRGDGFHAIASWMVAVEFGDRLTIASAEQSSYDIRFADDAPQPQKVDWPLEKDLSVRAHRLMEQAVGRSLPIRAALEKRIPAGAGLGGGSSDAAAMLVSVNRLFDLRMTERDLCGLAEKLGCDVAFLVGAMFGKPSALVTGLGETVEPLPLSEPIHLVLVLPPYGCPTGRVYAAFDEMVGQRAAVARERVEQLGRCMPLQPDAPFNDLAEPAARVTPELAETLAKLRGEQQLPMHVTGSGAAMFVVVANAQAGTALARQISGQFALPAVTTRTLPPPQS